MEGKFPSNGNLKIIRTRSTRTICRVVLIYKNENQLDNCQSGYRSTVISNHRGKFPVFAEEYRKSQAEDILPLIAISIAKLFVTLRCLVNHISMLKRSLSMEFDSEQFKASAAALHNSEASHTQGPTSSDLEDHSQSNKKVCHSPERSGYDENESDLRCRSWSKPRNKMDAFGRFGQTGDNSHVTQSRSIFSHENSCIYGNPKEEIKSIENPETSKEVTLFDNGSVNALDLSCKGIKASDDKPHEGNTYHNYHKTNTTGENSFARSHLQMKLVSPTHKKPSIPEQLQIAKIQQQQRRSIQQQQKLIQQMRRSLDPTSKSGNRSHHSNSSDSSQGSHKNAKYFANSTSNQEQNDLDHQGRIKDDYQPPLPGPHFPQYPYFEPGQHKELPDGHPILPLLDPVYFSALYNAHGFLPPSSPSIAAAFIGTLQDALPKLPLMFPSTSTSNSSMLPQKSNDNHN